MKPIEWNKKLAYAGRFFALNFPANENSRIKIAELHKIFDELILVKPEQATDADCRSLHSLINQLDEIKNIMLKKNLLEHRIQLLKRMAPLWKKRYWLGVRFLKKERILHNLEALPGNAPLSQLYHTWKQAIELHIELEHEGIEHKPMILFLLSWAAIVLCNIIIYWRLNIILYPAGRSLSWLFLLYIAVPFLIMSHYRMNEIKPGYFLLRYAAIQTCWSLIFIPVILINKIIMMITLDEWKRNINAILSWAFSVLGFFLFISFTGWIIIICLMPRGWRLRLSLILIALLIALYFANSLLLAEYIPKFDILHQKISNLHFPNEKAYLIDDIIRISTAIHIYAIFPFLVISTLLLLFAKLYQHRKNPGIIIPASILTAIILLLLSLNLLTNTPFLTSSYHHLLFSFIFLSAILYSLLEPKFHHLFFHSPHSSS